MLAVLKNPDFTDPEFAELVDLLNGYGGIAYTRDMCGRRPCPIMMH
jgi:hypothetical protein